MDIRDILNECLHLNVAAKFFEMPRKQCKAALDIYKKFVANMEVVAKFLAIAEVQAMIL